VTNPAALKVADALDARFAQSGLLPAALRAADREGQLRDDRYAHVGGIALAEGRCRTDAFRSRSFAGGRHHAGEEQHGRVRLRSDGDGELLLPGYARNPYALDRDAA
jgi:hypothetical protein